jgi:hypothetical protein
MSDVVRSRYYAVLRGHSFLSVRRKKNHYDEPRWEPTQPPTTHPEIPGRFGKFRVSLGDSGAFSEVSGVLGKFLGCIGKFGVSLGSPRRFPKVSGVIPGVFVTRGIAKHTTK